MDTLSSPPNPRATRFALSGGSVGWLHAPHLIVRALPDRAISSTTSMLRTCSPGIEGPSNRLPALGSGRSVERRLALLDVLRDDLSRSTAPFRPRGTSSRWSRRPLTG
jgi:hypothetical protein